MCDSEGTVIAITTQESHGSTAMKFMCLRLAWKALGTPYRLTYLRDWPPYEEMFGKIRRCDLIEGSGLLGMGFEISKAHTRPSISAGYLWIRMESSPLQLPLQPHVCFPLL